MLESGVAKECARMVLPLCYSNQNLYDWFMSFLDTLHQFKICSWNSKRTHGNCEACRKVFTEQFPSVSEALEWV